MFNTHPYYNADKFHFYGEEIMQHCVALRTFQGAGILAAAGSDFPLGPFDPRMAIQRQVTRTGFNGETWGANQKISVDEAIRVGTLNGAYETHEENIEGSITPGKLADLVVLADNHGLLLGVSRLGATCRQFIRNPRSRGKCYAQFYAIYAPKGNAD